MFRGAVKFRALFKTLTNAKATTKRYIKLRNMRSRVHYQRLKSAQRGEILLSGMCKYRNHKNRYRYLPTLRQRV